jgi:hypothetical protein
VRRPKSGPRCRPSRRNSRATSGARVRNDHENTARTLPDESPASNASRTRCSARSSPSRSASEKSGLTVSWAATTDSANGSRAQNSIRSTTTPGSAATLAAPRRAASSSAASWSVNTPSRTGRATSWATRLPRWSRLVTSTRQLALPGNRGRTCSASRTLSSRINIRRSASRLRHSTALPSTVSGIRPGPTASASSIARSASAGVTPDRRRGRSHEGSDRADRRDSDPRPSEPTARPGWSCRSRPAR